MQDFAVNNSSSALETFITLGRWAMGLLLWFFGIPLSSIDQGLFDVGAFFLALLIWAGFLRLALNILGRILFRYPPRGR